MCQRLMEGDRRVDCKIAIAIGAFDRRVNKAYSNRIDYVDLREPGVVGWPGHGGDQFVPYYTSSLDDATDLVVPDYYVVAIHELQRVEDAPGERWEVRLGHRTDCRRRVIVGSAGTLPAALCTAWLLVPR